MTVIFSSLKTSTGYEIRRPALLTAPHHLLRLLLKFHLAPLRFHLALLLFNAALVIGKLLLLLPEVTHLKFLLQLLLLYV